MMSSPYWTELAIWIRYNMKGIKMNPRWVTKYSRTITGIFSQHNLISKRGLYCAADLRIHAGINTTSRPAETPLNPSPVTHRRLQHYRYQTSSLPLATAWTNSNRPMQGRRDDSKKWNRRQRAHNTVTNTVSTLGQVTVQGDTQIS